MTGTAVSFGTLDWAVVGLYFIANTAICVWAAMKKEKDTADYFLASRSAGWFLIGSSIFASNIGAEHLIGLAGSGASSGMAFAHWELHSWLVLMLGWVFAPFYLRANIFTTPEFLERRYTPGTRTLLSGIFLASYILTKASVTIFAGAFAIQTILGYETINLPLFGEVDFFWFSAAFLVIITGVFVIAGGMLSVLWTEAMHVPVLLAGSAVLLVVGLNEIGGWDALLAANPDNLHLWRPLSTTEATQGFPGFLFDPSETPWLGVLLCSPIIGLWYWCTDQYIVQRVLSARGLKQARQGTIFAAYLKLAPVFIFLIPGMIAVALWKQKYPGFESIGDEPAGRLPGAGVEPAAHRTARPGAGRHVVGADERAGLAVQFHGHLVHRGFLQAAAAAIQRAAPGAHRAHRHGGRRGHRHDLDSHHAVHEQAAVQLPAAGAVAAGARHRGRVHGRHLLAARDAEVRLHRPRFRLLAGHAPPAVAGAASERRHRVARAHPGLRRHQLAVFQLPAVRIHLRGDRRGQQVHAPGLDRADRRADLQVGFGPAERR